MVAQSQPGGPPELYPCPRAFSVCLPGDPECVRTYRVVYNCCGGVCRVRESTGLLWVTVWVVERLYRAESIQMPILPRVFCLISSQLHIFFTSKLFNPVIYSNSMHAKPLKMVPASQAHCPVLCLGKTGIVELENILRSIHPTSSKATS